jgi:hypothetical protein
MQTPFKIDEAVRRRSNQRAGRINAQHVYLVSGKTHTMREMIERSGKTEKQIRALISKIRKMSDRTITWEKLT